MTVVSVEKDYDAQSLVIVAEFDAPIERVWQLWADPRQLERWWGPPTHPATVHRHDLSIGGEVTYLMIGPEGETCGGCWRVTAVESPTSLAFTDAYADRDGAPIADGPSTEVEVRLASHGSGTRMVLRFRFDSIERMVQVERQGAFDVYPQSVAQMDAVLSAAPNQIA